MSLFGAESKTLMIVLLFVFGAFSLVFGILSFMGKVVDKNKDPDEEPEVPTKKDNILKGSVFMCLAIVSVVNAIRYITNISVLTYISFPLLIITLVLFIVSEKKK